MTGLRYLIALGATNTIVTSASVRLILKTGVHCDRPVALCDNVLFALARCQRNQTQIWTGFHVQYLKGNIVIRRCWIVLICVTLKVADSSIVVVCYRGIGFGPVSRFSAGKPGSGEWRASKRHIKLDATARRSIDSEIVVRV